MTRTYTVKAGDTLTGIAVALGLAKKGPGNTLGDWAEAIAVAEVIANRNGIPWSGPPRYTAPIQAGQQLIIEDDAPPKSNLARNVGIVVFAGLIGFLAWKTT